MAYNQTRKYKFESNSHMIPHPSKQYKGGEDALLAKQNILVIADGVGGWAELGIDSGLYSKNLCNIIESIFERNKTYFIDRPDELLKISVAYNTQPGSSTITIITLNEQTGKLKIAYMGDSLTTIYSQDKMFKTKDNSRGFNQPYQVGLQGDDPQTCVKQSRMMKENDIIITGSDGIWDNLFDTQIQSFIANQRDITSLSNRVANAAFKNAFDTNFISPFSMKATQNGKQYKGGKPDDISVITARVISYY